METGGLLTLISAEAFQEALPDVVCFMHTQFRVHLTKVTFTSIQPHDV